jgi:hypothetical protein
LAEQHDANIVKWSFGEWDDVDWDQGLGVFDRDEGKGYELNIKIDFCGDGDGSCQDYGIKKENMMVIVISTFLFVNLSIIVFFFLNSLIFRKVKDSIHYVND